MRLHHKRCKLRGCFAGQTRIDADTGQPLRLLKIRKHKHHWNLVLFQRCHHTAVCANMMKRTQQDTADILRNEILQAFSNRLVIVEFLVAFIDSTDLVISQRIYHARDPAHHRIKIFFKHMRKHDAYFDRFMRQTPRNLVDIVSKRLNCLLNGKPICLLDALVAIQNLTDRTKGHICSLGNIFDRNSLHDDALNFAANNEAFHLYIV